jgi:endoglucanase
MRSLAVALAFFFGLCMLSFYKKPLEDKSWIRINLLGYKPASVKVAVWCSAEDKVIKDFQLVDSATGKPVYQNSAGKSFGAYGPFEQTCRLDFSAYKKPGVYYLKTGETRSPYFTIGNDVYKGGAGFCLRYMRQQRSGFNPFLKDSCHTHDGYTLYGPMPDSTHIDVSGGWHDASDYLQYATTSANATYHLLMAYRDFPNVFTDEKLANGLDGRNGRADVLDEAGWGLNWLLKMHPQKDWMFNQIADDRDHISMRIPRQDSQYHRGYERPVYFITGEPQQRGQFMNNTTGTSSTAAKFASAFALGSMIMEGDSVYSSLLRTKASTAYAFAKKKPGVTQTVSVRSPYIYAEDNWVDDMELAAVLLDELQKRSGNEKAHKGERFTNQAMRFAQQEKVTPWLGEDTAKHYQWYPFINLGHYELAQQLKGRHRDTIMGYYQQGIQRVWNKAKQNAFYRGIPFIWCSNNLTTSFAIQCYWYRKLSGDREFGALEQANFDWLFGCNPWGSSMVYGLPANADTPTDPHSAFTHLKNYPIDGGLVDGPVYGSIFSNLRGITLYHDDAYAAFQSRLAVYHDDYGDYSTNEPTMDGTASLIYLLAAREAENSGPAGPEGSFTMSHGGIIRGDSFQKKLAIVFTGDQFSDGGNFIYRSLKRLKVRSSFFLTGNFFKERQNKELIRNLVRAEHFVGNHSYAHLLYCDWNKRDSLLVSRAQFWDDLLLTDERMQHFGIPEQMRAYFLPPYEWYNDSIAAWTVEKGRQLINYTPGTLSHADYTRPSEKNYRSSDLIY